MNDVTLTTLLARLRPIVAFYWPQGHLNRSYTKRPSTKWPLPSLLTRPMMIPRSLSVFSSRHLLSTHRQARMSIQFHYDGVPSASLAVTIYIATKETMRLSPPLGRDRCMRFHSFSDQTLPSQPDGRVFGKLILSHVCDDVHGIAAAYI